MNGEGDDYGETYGGNPPFIEGSSTSEAASEGIRNVASSIRERVFDAIRSSDDGLTIDDIERTLGLRHQTAGPRVRELFLTGRIKDSQRTRKTRSGFTATIWVPDPRGIANESDTSGALKRIKILQKMVAQFPQLRDAIVAGFSATPKFDDSTYTDAALADWLCMAVAVYLRRLRAKANDT